MQTNDTHTAIRWIEGHCPVNDTHACVISVRTPAQEAHLGRHPEPQFPVELTVLIAVLVATVAAVGISTILKEWLPAR